MERRQPCLLQKRLHSSRLEELNFSVRAILPEDWGRGRRMYRSARGMGRNRGPIRKVCPSKGHSRLGVVNRSKPSGRETRQISRRNLSCQDSPPTRCSITSNPIATSIELSENGNSIAEQRTSDACAVVGKSAVKACPKSRIFSKKSQPKYSPPSEVTRFERPAVPQPTSKTRLPCKLRFNFARKNWRMDLVALDCARPVTQPILDRHSVRRSEFSLSVSPQFCGKLRLGVEVS